MSETKREPYEPPAVQRVRFAPGEVAAAGCKQHPNEPNSCCRNEHSRVFNRPPNVFGS